MRIAYFDCFAGISGNMILGALLNAGLSVTELKKELDKLHLKNYTLKVSKTKKNDLSSTYVQVIAKESNKKRTLNDINKIIDRSTLTPAVKDLSKRIFSQLAQAEAKAHGTTKNKIHFHEVGAIDAIVDIVGAVAGIKLLNIEKIICSPLNVGRGMVKTKHGTFPIPAPATAELLKRKPIYSTDIQKELVTPTGAAIITTLASSFGNLPAIKTETIGYGAGSYNLNIPNLLRIIIGEAKEIYREEQVTILETNIDDMNPELFDHVMQKLFAAGALDVYLTPIQMKKNRPALKLSVLTGYDKLNKITDIIFSETTTLGVRVLETYRKKLDRETKNIQTKYGKIKVKVGKAGSHIKNIAPEYENCHLIATQQNIPIKAVYDEALKAARKVLALIILVVTLIGSSFHPAQAKTPIGYIDIEKVFSEYRETKNAEERIEKAKDILRREVDRQKLASKREKVLHLANDLTTKLENDIIRGTKDVARKENIPLVLDKKIVLFGGIDLTEKTIRRLNKQ